MIENLLLKQCQAKNEKILKQYKRLKFGRVSLLQWITSIDGVMYVRTRYVGSRARADPQYGARLYIKFVRLG